MSLAHSVMLHKSAALASKEAQAGKAEGDAAAEELEHIQIQVSFCSCRCACCAGTACLPQVNDVAFCLLCCNAGLVSVPPGI